MGYSATSADDVYRYALRLDGERHLTDRFGFSIVLVNDGSTKCLEFLREYCVDLCLRTADRIRFVFFSELPKPDFVRIVQRLRNGISRRWGVLGGVLESLDRVGRWVQFDEERSPWDELRPAALAPLRQRDDIEKHLSWQCESLTAMPGVGEAMRFAQRLGIGRLVPCIVVFNDIGDLAVDVLPIGPLSPAQVYNRIRDWIDEFYAANRWDLDTWTAVESGISELLSKSNSRLRALQDWRESTLAAWADASRLSSIIAKLEAGTDNPTQVLKAAASELQSWEIRETAQKHARQLAERDETERLLRDVDLAELRIMHANEATAFLATLRELRENLPRRVVQELELSEMAKLIAQAPSLATIGRRWWNRATTTRVSIRRFKDVRPPWVPTERDAFIVAYRELDRRLADLPLLLEPEDGARRVIEGLASNIGVGTLSKESRAASAQLQQAIRDYLRHACGGAPWWLTKIDPELRLGDVLPRSCGTKFPLSGSTEYPRLSRAITVYHQDPSKYTDLYRLRADLIRRLQTSFPTRLPPVQSQLVSRILGELRQIRLRTEATALRKSNADPASTESTIDPVMARDFHEALDRYQRTIAQIVFPYRRDPDVQRIPLQESLDLLVGLQKGSRPAPAERWRASIEEAVLKDSLASAELVRGISDLGKANPQVRLADVIAETLTSARMAELAEMLNTLRRVKSEEPKVDRTQIHTMLDVLSEQELQAIARRLVTTSAASHSFRRAILIALGLYSGDDSQEAKDAVRTDVRISMAEVCAPQMSPGIHLTASMRSFNWLHFTDLHQGLEPQGWLWPGVRDILFTDLEQLHKRCGPWDLVLFSGDLTQRGSVDEFNKFDATLTQLFDHLRQLGSNPSLLAVPGNHDLIRPDPSHPETLVLARWPTYPEVQAEFWRDASSPYRKFVDQAFAPYTAWHDAHPFTAVPRKPGMLPGDFSAVLAKDGLRLGVVGLNSAFLQVSGGNFEGKLAVDVRQFHAACGGDGPAWVKSCDFALLMTHHPPDWLSPESREHLFGEIAVPGRFSAHMFGHMHEHMATTLIVGGSAPRRQIQGNSLFGLETFGDGKLDRRHGYAAGRITVDDRGDASLRIWPRIAKRHRAGHHLRIVQDLDSFELQDDQGTSPEPLPLARKPK